HGKLLCKVYILKSFCFLPYNLCLQNESSGLYTGDGSVDIKGQPVLKSNTGNWRACPFILGTECCERLAFFGIATNLVSYLTKTMHEGNVSAARNVSNWTGTAYLTPLIGAVLADVCWGRYWTIAVFSAIYFLGMCTLTLTATVPALKPAECVDSICPPATPAEYLLFYLGLYLIALGTGGIKPCVSSFGADQFDDTDPKERAKKGSFFNWFFFSIYLGALVSSILIVWIQENAGWGLGFGIPALFMGIAIVSFFSGTPLYRFQNPGESPLTRLCQVLVASFRKWNLEVPTDSILLYETPDKTSVIEGSRKLDHTNDLKCLDKAAVITDIENKNGDFSNPWRLCTVTQVEELKILIRMFPIWATGIIIGAVYAQLGTLFVEQGMMMDRTIGSFSIPAASLSACDVISVIFWVPVYDKVIVPIVRKFTGREKGFTELQRMGIGHFISVLCMVSAALVEMKRLALAQALGLVDENVPIPLSITWQIPQYFLFGAAEVFTFIGQLEFFYEQSPDSMRSLFVALPLLTTSMGRYLSSFILTVVTSITTKGGKAGWIPDNLNEGHLDYFFWLVAALSVVNWVVFVFCAKMYKPKKVL
ncbi:protein NRT1/ PTR FAMILY 8.3-like, partial [Camellia sinensis]